MLQKKQYINQSKKKISISINNVFPSTVAKIISYDWVSFHI